MQLRSCETVLALVHAGRELLQNNSLETLSVDLICRTAGATVGSFYSRFESKENYFVILQRLVTRELGYNLNVFISRHSNKPIDVNALTDDLVTVLVTHFRTHTGVLRASLENARLGSWRLLRGSGDTHRKALEEQIGPWLTKIGTEDRGLRIMFTYQLILGVLVHTTLNDVGPLRLFDERLVTELKRTTRLYLGNSN